MQSEKRFTVYDSTGRIICHRSVSATNRNQIMVDFDAITLAIEYINDIDFSVANR